MGLRVLHLYPGADHTADLRHAIQSRGPPTSRDARSNPPAQRGEDAVVAFSLTGGRPTTSLGPVPALTSAVLDTLRQSLAEPRSPAQVVELTIRLADGRTSLSAENRRCRLRHDPTCGMVQVTSAGVYSWGGGCIRN
ncbi:hypothetical protein GCM10008019_42980 [Deinococcus soli (ex Cha et al. 2016)]|nr:hypothetical protein GCM10008019_42980 [Deinococcus soli (ex Cha et al. 2016)]